MTEEDKIPVKVEVRAKLEAKTEIPPDASGRAIHMALDAVSPFTNAMGFVGDLVGKLRSEESVYMAFDRAKQIKHERGEEIKPIHRKNLVPLLEHISCEGPESELMEMWAQLLAGAGEEFDEQLASYVDILSRIGGKTVELMDKLYLFFDEPQLEQVERNLLESNWGVIDMLMPREEHFDYEIASVTEAAKNILGVKLLGPFVVKSVDIPSMHPREIAQAGPGALPNSTLTLVQGDFPEERPYWDLLELHNLIRRHDKTFETMTIGGGRYRGSATIYELTPFGIRFIRRCRGVT